MIFIKIYKDPSKNFICASTVHVHVGKDKDLDQMLQGYDRHPA